MGGNSMYLLKSIVDVLIILLLLRLLIRSNEAFFNPIYTLIYRITDPVLIPSRFITRDPTRSVLISLLVLVATRGIVYVSLKPMTFIAGLGMSLLDLFRLLFRGYMVIWLVSLLSERGFGISFMHIIERAFNPLNSVRARFGIPIRQLHLFSFIFLWILYALLSTAIRYAIGSKMGLSASSMLYGLGEGLILFLALFPFPGFFSVVIIIGALLSWVSPDPSNPVVQAIYGISEPLLAPFRRVVPLLGGLDISPILALLCFQIIGGLGQQMVGGFMRAI
jgi:YggT family protein